jgi:hypothetical protein
VLVRVHAAAVTPTELLWMPTWKTRTREDRPFPIILGHEFSGGIAACGAGVTEWAAGDPVYGLNDWFADGSHAEYCVAPAAPLAPKPRSLDHVQAAVVPISALTAWQALFERASLRAGQRVLIHGAAGSVGSFAVQLARWRGARSNASVRTRPRPRWVPTRSRTTATRFEEHVRTGRGAYTVMPSSALWRKKPVRGALVTIAARARGCRTRGPRRVIAGSEPRTGLYGPPIDDDWPGCSPEVFRLARRAGV